MFKNKIETRSSGAIINFRSLLNHRPWELMTKALNANEKNAKKGLERTANTKVKVKPGRIT